MSPNINVIKVIENDTIQSGTHDFLLTFHSNHRPISHRFRDKRRYPSKIANFYHPVYLTPPIWYRHKRWKSSSDGATRWSKKF